MGWVQWPERGRKRYEKDLILKENEGLEHKKKWDDNNPQCPIRRREGVIKWNQGVRRNKRFEARRVDKNK